MAFSMGVKTNIPVLLSKIDRMKKLVDKGWHRDIDRMMRQARRTVRSLTPRSKKSKSGKYAKKGKRNRQGQIVKRHTPLADGWTIHTIGKGKKDRAPVLSVIYNKLTHRPTGVPLKRALVHVKKTGEVKNYTVLDILEYGSKAHVILPVAGKVLRFVSEDKTVFTRSVHHPGTKAYGMVRLTTIKLRQMMRALNRKWRRRFFR